MRGLEGRYAKHLERVLQRLQYPLIKEYALNHIRDPTII